MHPLRLMCLGTPRLLGPDGGPIHLRTKKHLGLLIYLAVEPPIHHRRERLATLLWPDAGEKEGRHSLATALSVLRSHVGRNGIDKNRDAVRLVPGRVIVDISGPGELQLEESGIAGFLEDFEIPEAVDFSHWVDRLRARVMPTLRDRLTRRLEVFRTSGDTAGMVRIADQLQRLDPLSEEAVQAMMESRTLSGDRIGSLRAYETWKSRLAEELGAVPSPDLERLASRLRRSRTPATVWLPATATCRAEKSDPVFVGRASDFNLCYEKWRVSKRGESCQVHVLGERGVGRSTLLARLTAAVCVDGGSVARAAGRQGSKAVEFALLQDITNELLGLPGAGATDPEALAILGSIAPQVCARWPSLLTMVSQAPAISLLRIADALACLIRSTSEELPLVIAIDDLHLADESSVSALSRATQLASKSPVLAIFTYTSESQVVLPKTPESDVSEIVLRSLNANDVHELLSLQLAEDSSPGPSILSSIAIASRGNPQALSDLLSDWKRNGTDSAAVFTRAMTQRSPASCPARPSQDVAALIRGSDPSLILCLSLAAMLNDLVDDFEMYEILGMREYEAMRGLCSLEQAGVLIERAGKLTFQSTSLQFECYNSTPACIRKRLHSAVADRLVSRTADIKGVRALELAWHLFRAERPEAPAFLLTGSRAALRCGMPHEAELALRTGLVALEGKDYRSGVFLLAMVLQELGQWRESIEVIGQLEASLTDEEKGVWTSLTLLAKRSLGELSAPDLITGTDTLISLARSSSGMSVRASAAATAVRLLTLTRDPERIDALAAIVRGIDIDQASPYDRLHLLLATAWTGSAQGSISESLHQLQHATELAVEHSLCGSIFVRLLIGLGNTHSVMGHYDKAIDPLEQAESIARRMGNDTLVAECSTQLATAFGRLGQSPAQIDWARRANVRFPAKEWSPGTLGASYELGLGLALEGRSEEARSVAVGLLTSLPTGRPAWIRQASLLCAADIMALSGHAARGTRLARSGIAVGRGAILNDTYAGQFSRWVAQIMIEDATPDNGLEILDSEFPSVERLHWKDRAELRAARACLHKHAGSLDADELDEVRLGLAALPPGIIAILRGLGLHPDQARRYA